MSLLPVGFQRLNDVIKVKDMGIYGVIVGKALYEKRINLKELMEVVC
jgi:phosphoribosylformimino-5-aminoimidazole carboxamide ribotide isomerase